MRSAKHFPTGALTPLALPTLCPMQYGQRRLQTVGGRQLTSYYYGGH